ncbi:MAG: hypothetical protein AAB758_00905 [Patescibacteria group bacterium]
MSNKPVTLGQTAQIRKMAVDKGIHRDVFQIRLNDGTIARFLDSLKPPVGDLGRWASNYEKLFGQKPDLSQVRIPEKPEGVGPMRLLVGAKELVEWTGNHPLEGVKEALKKHAPGWEYAEDLDADITKNDRDPRNGSYAFWVRDVQAADDDMANLSANDLVERGILGITALEGELLEADYFFEKGEHLDPKTVTLYAGSRYRDGRVPFGGWLGSRFSISWCDASHRDPLLRSRRVWT